ncbi:hypothetical protein LAZ67_5002889 [Cordylochernes scorpioides]|uniref:Uncharacterized protein n=1 Tax=Cordylochernes scorpioides TaxID=51811 RepID=A0ABY6KGT7_9ARAC|nr:hypothetical protein LAZ67_5002889 [Cordylochernes scorpioides]
MRNTCQGGKKEVEERSYVVYSKQAAVSRGRTAAYRRRRCTSWKILRTSVSCSAPAFPHRAAVEDIGTFR